MTTRSKRLPSAVAILLIVSGCTGADRTTAGSTDGSASEWQGTITTEGDVTTVVNESGSVWGGTARLVEELSIGVARGDEPYMFGYVAGVWATPERIFVVDSQVPAVRAYDQDGRHLMDLGGPGEGPGEYQIPNSVAVTPDGRVLVREGRPGQRTSVYSLEGESLDTWYGDSWLSSSVPPVLTYEGELYSQTFIEPDPDRIVGMATIGPEGPQKEPLAFPEVDFERPRLEISERSRLPVPLSPRVVHQMLPSRAMVAGLNSDYRFIVDRPDGFRMVVERYWEPIPVSDEERDWRIANTVAWVRREGNPSFTWDGAEIPDHHPAFSRFALDRAGRIWALRRSAVERMEGCTEDPLDESVETVVPCYRNRYTADVFDEETGKFLGEVELPDGVTLGRAFIDGETLATAVEDDAGIVMVKRYRLVLPGG